MKTKEQVDNFVAALNTICKEHDMFIIPMLGGLTITDTPCQDPDTQEGIRTYMLSIWCLPPDIGVLSTIVPDSSYTKRKLKAKQKLVDSPLSLINPQQEPLR